MRPTARASRRPSGSSPRARRRSWPRGSARPRRASPARSRSSGWSSSAASRACAPSPAPRPRFGRGCGRFTRVASRPWTGPWPRRTARRSGCRPKSPQCPRSSPQRPSTGRPGGSWRSTPRPHRRSCGWSWTASTKQRLRTQTCIKLKGLCTRSMAIWSWPQQWQPRASMHSGGTSSSWTAASATRSGSGARSRSSAWPSGSSSGRWRPDPQSGGTSAPTSSATTRPCAGWCWASARTSWRSRRGSGTSTSSGRRTKT
mmetsp:Transcript_493/g.1494  ORF Transcript_493/g.1494 Transcript_493/m.1494 type:complete len:258 (+) Transcript_493:156-929(+)